MFTKVIGGNNMNIQEMDILNILMEEPYINQRTLAEITGHSLGIVNRSIRELIQQEYLDEFMTPTIKAKREIEPRMPKRGIILAAGFGMRMTPISMEVPKGLIEIKGEPLIERLIKQFNEVGISEIYIVVGFMKECYEYLIDKYHVKLIVNPDYAVKNNLYSVKLVSDLLTNAYITPCDIWCKDNPFRKYELYSWYMVSDFMMQESTVKVNRKKELVLIDENIFGNAMIGITYLLKKDADVIKKRIEELCGDRSYDKAFWEQALYGKHDMTVLARVVQADSVIEINTYEQLREIDSNSSQLENKAMQAICDVFQTTISEVKDVTILKKGMTNRSFLFGCQGKKYIMRIPGEGTDKLINRKQEADVYNVVGGRGICDNVVYVNPDKGYKITEYWEEARTCDSRNFEDVRKCMIYLRNFHGMKLKVEYEFNLFQQIQFYEELWGEKKSVYKDYNKTKENVLSLRKYIEEYIFEKVLTHIDAVPDNFLFINNDEIRLIDWEYAAMQDPHVDIAMFCIYALYSRQQIDEVIDLYFEKMCDIKIRVKIYCYIAVCGLIWSNWCEYKRHLGVEFGEYSIRQYRYAKDYFRIVQEELKKLEE